MGVRVLPAAPVPPWGMLPVMRVWAFLLSAAVIGLIGALLIVLVSTRLAIPMFALAVLYGVAGAWWV